MNIYLHETEEAWRRLLPFTALKSISQIRIGILTLQEKWLKSSKIANAFIVNNRSIRTQISFDVSSNIILKSHIIYSPALQKALLGLPDSSTLSYDENIIAYKLDKFQAVDLLQGNLRADSLNNYSLQPNTIDIIQRLEDIFLMNESQIKYDFDRITANRKSVEIPTTNQFNNPRNIFIEEGADIEYSILNPGNGRLYFGRNTKVLPGALLSGTCAMLDQSIIKMGSKIYGGTTLGLGSKIGGEVKNIVIGDYSNKGHEGYLGNSVIGDWCNLGADTNASNLKNNYSNVRIYDYSLDSFRQSNQLFIGLMMGDHSKCSINTMFNTGTVVGFACNVFDAGFHSKFIPDFSWGSPKSYTTHNLEGFFKSAKNMMDRKKQVLSIDQKARIKRIFMETEALRKGHH